MKYVLLNRGSNRARTSPMPQLGWAMLLILMAAALVAGCSSDDSVTDSPQTGSCIDCHTSKDQILATAEADTSGEPGEAGEG